MAYRPSIVENGWSLLTFDIGRGRRESNEPRNPQNRELKPEKSPKQENLAKLPRNLRKGDTARRESRSSNSFELVRHTKGAGENRDALKWIYLSVFPVSRI